MRSDTQSITLDVRAARAFEFLADPENLPRWAVGFARSIRRDNASWIVTTAAGEMVIRYETDAERGIVDFHFTAAPGLEAVAYSRVLPNGDGAEYVFTQFQPPGMPDAMFEGQVRALSEEFVVLRSLLRARSVCPA
jgi:hypothetical protein